jgi:hypothetical protein
LDIEIFADAYRDDVVDGHCYPGVIAFCERLTAVSTAGLVGFLDELEPIFMAAVTSGPNAFAHFVLFVGIGRKREPGIQLI